MLKPLRVSLTGKATWQIGGGPTIARKDWAVVACSCNLCASGRFVAVDEAVEGYGQRHIAVVNLREFHLFGTDAFPPSGNAYLVCDSNPEGAKPPPKRYRFKRHEKPNT